MAALSTKHDVTGRRLASSIYSLDIYGLAPKGGATPFAAASMKYIKMKWDVRGKWLQSVFLRVLYFTRVIKQHTV
jgi:hypothetical protein